MFGQTNKILLFVVFSLMFSSRISLAQETNKLKDTDLDGISDNAEVTVYKTDPNKADTDGDKYLDAQEITDKTDPLDPNSHHLSVVKEQSSKWISDEMPLMWYIGRISGIAAFVMFTFVACLGLMMTSKLLLKIKLLSVPGALETHSFIASILAFSLVIAHIVALMFDEYIHLSITEVLVPFTLFRNIKSSLDFDLNIPIALGTIALYLSVVLIVTSQLRNKVIPSKIWRLIHYSSFIFYITFMLHGILSGSDSKELWMQILYASSFILVLTLVLLRIFAKKYFLPKRSVTPPTTPIPSQTKEKFLTPKNPPRKRTGQLVSRSQHTERVAEIKISMNEQNKMEFIAGQFISLKVGDNVYRSYSISSDAKNTLGFEMLIENKHIGIGSNYINALKIGDPVEFVGPSGRFILPNNVDKNIVFIATGTGVAPILSMLQKLIDIKYTKPIRLYFGVYCAQDVLKKDFLDMCEKTLKDFKYYLVYQNDLTEEDKKDSHVSQGLVTKIIDLSDTKDTIYGICGHPNMCTDMVALLEKSGVTHENIFHEKFSVAVKPATTSIA